MTIQRRILVGLNDIKAVSFECLKCPFKITMSPDKVGEIPKHCADGHDWFIGERFPILSPPLVTFTDSLTKLRFLATQGTMGFRILLEIAEP
jgi:hypothetical protein